MQLDNNCVAASMVHRKYKNEFVSKKGGTVTIEKPVKFVVNDGADISSQIQDVTEQTTDISVDQRKNVAWNFSSQELTMNISDYSDKYIKPAMIQLANKIDTSVLGLYKHVPLAAGTAGTTPATFAALGAAANNLDMNSVPQDGRGMIIDSNARWALGDTFKDFNNDAFAKKARGGMLGDIAGFGRVAMDQNVNYHTAGDTAGTVLVDGASQDGATLAVDGFTAATGTIKEGDVFTIAGVNHVNPITREDTGKLQQFTVISDATIASNETTLSISPSIVTSGAYQTVSAGPADGAAVTFLGSHRANLAFHKNALALVTVPLALPDSVNFKARATHNGLSIRVMKGFDIKTDTEIIRLDVFFGVKAIYPELATRLLG